MIKVLHGKKHGFIGDNRLYIGRACYGQLKSVLANPYQIGKDGNRETVIAKYKVWLNEEIDKKGEVYNEIYRLKAWVELGNDLELACWCKPEKCHGDVIKEVIENLLNGEI